MDPTFAADGGFLGNASMTATILRNTKILPV